MKPLWPRLLSAALVFGIAPVALAQPRSDAGEASVGVIDRVVATVENQVLTQSELEFEARVALIQHGAQQAASAPLDDRTLRASLDFVIGQRLHAAEADKLQAFVLDEGEVDQALSDFEEKIGGRAALEQFLRRFEADRQWLGNILARSLRAERILDSKIRLKAQVSDSEIRRYYDAHQAELSGQSYEEVRPALKEKLMRDRYQELAAAEMQQLRRTANVRIIAPGFLSGEVSP